MKDLYYGIAYTVILIALPILAYNFNGNSILDSIFSVLFLGWLAFMFIRLATWLKNLS
ncbi:hypothetical protein [Flammeovirga kamogawensis]|uniref:Uncharacterized protein n=1 Tax=Flammeovirga kamogawensis TaxID=373891 RepID=A0ABX8H2A7_9BACT|nr:hypothetical protein [Flammeovirga kamogawensis]MBB6462324.1 hypothetical protein [Flammeovirga kamogawensis]QWG09442.1 hypothetical protein KM029_22810 [Flammeovirga kamogawensis]